MIEIYESALESLKFLADKLLLRLVDAAAGELHIEVLGVRLGVELRDERRLYFFLHQALEVHLRKPRMLHDLLAALVPQPLRRVLRQQFLQQVLQLRRNLH